MSIAIVKSLKINMHDKIFLILFRGTSYDNLNAKYINL
jgi:hypothetical protein